MRRQKNSAHFNELHGRFMYALDLLRRAMEMPNSKYVVIDAATQAFVVAHHLVHVLVTDKQVPTSQQALFERTVRELDRKKTPRDVVGWFKKNMPSVELLIQSVNWPDKGAAPERSRALDSGLVIHNQTTVDPTANMAMIEAAIPLMRNSGVPRIEEIIYGDVYLVGDIERSKKVAAKYFAHNDTIRILVVKRFEDEFVKTLIHEFGHRYWRKVVSRDTQREWHVHHDDVGARVDKKVEIPEVGSVVETDRGMVTIEAIVPLRGELAFKMSTGGYIPVKSYIRIEKKNLLLAAYPTPYAATNAEEHFCDALKLFCTGELSQEHREAFVRIFHVRDLPTPKPSEPVEVSSKSGQLALFNPSRRAASTSRRLSRL